jgi:hypothetical protein
MERLTTAPLGMARSTVTGVWLATRAGVCNAAARSSWAAEICFRARNFERGLIRSINAVYFFSMKVSTCLTGQVKGLPNT